MQNTLHRKNLFSKPEGSLARQEALAGYLLIAPNIIFFIVFVLAPILFTIVLSFSKGNALTGLEDLTFIGPANYVQQVNDPNFWIAFQNNLVYSIGTVFPQLAIALLLAVVLNEIRLRGLLRTMIFMPYISSSVAIAVVWMVLFSPTRGPINSFLRQIGIMNPPMWLGGFDTAMITIILISIWAGVGYSMVIYLAGLQSVPRELYEASQIDGAGPFSQLWYITIPLLSPTTFYLLITGIIASFNAFDLIRVATRGGPGTSTTILPMYIYRLGFQFYQMDYASAVALTLMVIIFFVTLIQWQGQKRFTDYLHGNR